MAWLVLVCRWVSIVLSKGLLFCMHSFWMKMAITQVYWNASTLQIITSIGALNDWLTVVGKVLAYQYGAQVWRARENKLKLNTDLCMCLLSTGTINLKSAHLGTELAENGKEDCGERV